MGDQRLTVCGITANSEDRLEHWILRVLESADELVLLVDDASSDGTLEIARRYCDQVHVVEHPPFIELVMDWALRQATGDWILWLDDDELLHAGFREAIRPALEDRRLTHAHLQSRAVVDLPDGRREWLRQFPWFPDPRLRLVRNLPSVFHHAGRLHSPFAVAGDGRVLDGEAAAIYHLDLLVRTRAEREAKVERYRGNDAPSCEEYYLYEDYRGSLETEPFDVSAVFREPAAAAIAEGERRSARDAPAPIDAVSLDELRRRLRAYAPKPDVFGAEYLAHTVPGSLGANRGQTAVLTVRNTSGAPWRAGGTEPGWVTLRYHWRHPDHGIVLREGDRSLLPDVVAPGETVTFPIGIWTPFEPGTYALELDLRAEGVGWFSEHGVPPLVVPVEVRASDRVLVRARTSATLRPAAPPRRRRSARAAERVRAALGHPLRSGLRGTSVVPIAPVRVLDTRDGTGAPGAEPGPVRAGATITLELTEPLGVPGHARGVVGNLAVPTATYNGFATALAGDGTGGDGGFVGVYFNDRGEPTVNQVVVSLGGPDAVGGRISLRLSDNHPGTAELLLDLVAYLA